MIDLNKVVLSLNKRERFRSSDRFICSRVDIKIPLKSSAPSGGYRPFGCDVRVSERPDVGLGRDTSLE